MASLTACTTALKAPVARTRVSANRRQLKIQATSGQSSPRNFVADTQEALKKLAFASAAAAALVASAPSPVLAIPQTSACATDPCDGKDFSNRDLRQEFYTKGSLKGANFTNSNLAGVTLFGADLSNAILEGANLQNADLGQTNLSGANLKNAIVEGAIVSSARLERVQLEGSDWTDVIIRKDINNELCALASGTNPVTGVDTRESLMCP